MSLRIEDISKLPEDIPVRAELNDEGGITRLPGKTTREFAIVETRDKIMADMKQLLEGKMEEGQVDNLMEELFTETFEHDSWLNQYSKADKIYNYKKREALNNENMQFAAARSQSQVDGPAPTTVKD